jgi:hypothetical protein
VAVKLGRKEIPAGHTIQEFTYNGRLASAQADFGVEVGRADLDAVDQEGVRVGKYYHGGVVQSGDGKWWVYLEWGKDKAVAAWVGGEHNQDFQFVSCDSEKDARAFFAKQMASKNNKRLVEKTVSGQQLWVSKGKSNGYTALTAPSPLYGLPAGSSAAPAPAPAAAPAPPEPEPEPEPEILPFAPALASLVERHTSGRAAETNTIYKLTYKTYASAVHVTLPPIPKTTDPVQQNPVLIRWCDLILPDRQIAFEDIASFKTTPTLSVQTADGSFSVASKIAKRDGSWLRQTLMLHMARRRAAQKLLRQMKGDAA